MIRPTHGGDDPDLGSGQPVTLAFGGDVHFESPIREQLDADPAGLLAPIAPELQSADLAMINLETAITDRGTPQPKTYTFRAPATAFEALESAGVDVVTLANNHGMDFGPVGFTDTLAAAADAGMPLVGAGVDEDAAYAPYLTERNGQRIAILGATDVLDDHLIEAWTATADHPGLASALRWQRLVRAVRDARAQADTVVVYLHWGSELVNCPTDRQRTLARQMVDAGADIVVGSHAHVLLGAGRLDNAFVAYGLGNFVFYAFRPETQQTGVLTITATGRRIDDARWQPAVISSGIPQPLTGAPRREAMRTWRDLRGCTDLTS